MDDLLSEEEVAALIMGMAETETLREKSDVTEFDFITQERIIRGRMPTLEMIAERFARDHRKKLFNLTRRTTEIGVVGINVVRFSEYLRNLFLPTSLNIVKMEPFVGNILVTYDPKLIFSAVDYLYGGLGKFTFRIAGREFTQIEQHTIDLMLDLVFTDFPNAWNTMNSNIDPIMTLQSTEVNPQFANIVGPADPVVVMEMSIDLEGVGGELHFVIPYESLTPYIDFLESGTITEGGNDPKWMNRLHQRANDVNVKLTAKPRDIQLSVKEINALKVGDVIDYPHDTDDVVLSVKDTPIYRGTLHNHETNYTVELNKMNKLKKGK
jgi:flagellar motor switch protein FliM